MQKQRRSARSFGQVIRTNPEWVLAPGLFVALMVIWHLVTSKTTVPSFVLPPPGRVWTALISGLKLPFSDPSGYWYHAIYTLSESLLGFFLGSSLGILCGVLVAHSRLVERTLYPYILGFQSLPKVAIAPLFVIWFGFGMTPKVIITSIITFFPLLVNAIAGCRSVESERLDLLRALGATQMQIFSKITFPSSLPFIFAGLQQAAVLSVIGAIVGEFVGAQRGLGVLIMQANYTMNVANVYAVLVILVIFGLGFHLFIRALERKFCFWAQRGLGQQYIGSDQR